MEFNDLPLSKASQRAKRGRRVRKAGQGPERSLKALDATLWRYFSEFIRLRDSDANGYCRCITCGRPHHHKEMDAGHFVQRNRKAVKFDERNVHAQCTACNRYGHGEQFEYAEAIDKRYGPGTARLLKDLGNVRVKLDRLWYESQIERYKLILKDKKNIPAIVRGLLEAKRMNDTKQ